MLELLLIILLVVILAITVCAFFITYYLIVKLSEYHKREAYCIRFEPTTPALEEAA